MRRSALLCCGVVIAAAFAAACVADRPLASRPPHDAHFVNGDGLPGHFNDYTRIDTGGGRLPDLVVDYAATAQHWVVREEKMAAEFCSVQEGGVTPGLRRIIRFTVTTPNIGDADVFIGNPLAHADPNGDGDFGDSDGMYEFAPCHDHFHFRNYAQYRLIERRADGSDGRVWRAAKKGFCMLDTDPNPTSTYSGEQPAGDRNYYSCGTKTLPGFQGVSHGWADTYIFFLGGQYFVLDGGDGQPEVPPGDYWIEVTVNPGYAPSKRGKCNLVTEVTTAGTTVCHNFAEKSYANNMTRVPVTIPDHPGRDGYGPEKGSKVYDYEPMKTGVEM